jgi:hypothetical protein
VTDNDDSRSRWKFAHSTPTAASLVQDYLLHCNSNISRLLTVGCCYITTGVVTLVMHAPSRCATTHLCSNCVPTLYCLVLHCLVLHCLVLSCTALPCTALYCSQIQPWTAALFLRLLRTRPPHADAEVASCRSMRLTEATLTT